MIPAAAMHRLLVHVLRSILEDQEPENPSEAANRERLIEWAGTHDLDLQDVATAYRVASGEGFTAHHDELHRDETDPRWLGDIARGPR